MCLLMIVLNLGLFDCAPRAAGSAVTWLQFDREGITNGQLWRLLTGNLVHWSPEHFLLDVGAFLVIGLIYERFLGRSYPWLLLAAATTVGLSVWLLQPDVKLYRGLSGVDSGQFAAALCLEVALARRHPRRWVWVGPAAAVFLVKVAYECATGQMFFATDSLGNIGQPMPLAHAAGVAAACGIMWVTEQVRKRAESKVVAGTTALVFPWTTSRGTSNLSR